MAKDNKINVDIQAQAASIVRDEKANWSDATAFVTDKVSFQMRNFIRQMRRNYWGVFENPQDPTTGRKKIWIPLTQSLVDAVVKNIDLDTKDINVIAKTPDAVGLAAVARNIIRTNLDDIGEDSTYFGEELDMMERNLAIDGTAVWKTLERNGKNGKKETLIRTVDLLNIYVDPTVKSLQSAYRVTERALMTKDEVMGMDGWINKDVVMPTTVLSRNDADLSTISTTKLGTKFVDVYETWGKIPKSLITGNKNDKDEEVEGHIIVSGIDSSSPVTHVVELNTKVDTHGRPLRPYEEAWYSRVNGRWYGRGIAELVWMLQLWQNTIVNIRINRSYVSQLGLFKIRKGAGITPQMLGRLSANGVVSVNNMDDIQQMVVQEASQASYQDEGNINDWAQRVTSAFESVTGEQLPASTPATNAVIATRNAQSAFVFVKEGMGMFLKRWIKRHFIPTLMKNIKAGDIIRVQGDTDELRKINEQIANKIVMEQLNKTIDEAQDDITALPTAVDVAAERDRIKSKLETQADMFVKLLKKPDLTKYDIDVIITNETVDKAVTVQNLLSSLQLVPEQKDIILRHVFDLMGLDSTELKKETEIQSQQVEEGAIPSPGALQVPGSNEQQITTAANTA